MLMVTINLSLCQEYAYMYLLINCTIPYISYSF